MEEQSARFMQFMAVNGQKLSKIAETIRRRSDEEEEKPDTRVRDEHRYAAKHVGSGCTSGRWIF
jgi:hypothetical protein